MKKKVIGLSLSILLFVSMIAIVMLSIDSFYVNAVTETKEEIAERFTAREKFEYNGQEYLIENYPTLYAQESSVTTDVNIGSTIVRNNDAIINIIPYEYFLNEGKYDYAGEKYGFFIENTKDSYGTMHNIVLVYKLSYQTYEDAEIKTMLIPLFEYEYLTIDKEYGNFKVYEYLPGVEYSQNRYMYWQSYNKEDSENKNTIVVAAPQKGVANYADVFAPMNKYYIKNITGELILKSIQDCAEEDDDYDRGDADNNGNDTGLLISGTYFNYTGEVLQKTTSTFFKDSAIFAANVFFDSALGKYAVWFEAGKIVLKEAFRPDAQYEMSSGNNNFKNYFNSVAQKKNYEVYLRDCYIHLKDNEDKIVMLRPANVLSGETPFVEMNYVLDNMGTSDYTCRTRVESKFVFEVSTIDGKEKENIECKNEMIIGDQFKPIFEDMENMIYVTNSYSSYLKFTPKKSGEYEFFTKGNYNTRLDMYENSSLSGEVTSGETFAGNNKRITKTLIQGKTYYFHMDTYGDTGRRSFPLVVNYIPEKIILGEKESITLTKEGIWFSYVSQETKNVELSVKTNENNFYTLQVYFTNENNAKEEYLSVGNDKSLSFLVKKGIRYYFLIKVNEAEATGTQFPAEVLLENGKNIKFAESIGLNIGYNCLKFDAQVAGQYILNNNLSNTDCIEIYNSDGELLNFDEANKKVALEKGLNFIFISNLIEQPIDITLYTGEQATFVLGTEKDQNYNYTLLDGCQYIKIKATEGIYQILCGSGGVFENVYYKDFENPIQSQGGIAYLKEDNYYVKVNGGQTGTLIVKKLELSEELNLILQNSDNSMQESEVIKGNEYEICILDKNGQSVFYDQLTFSLKYDNKTIELTSSVFRVPADIVIGTSLEIVAKYQDFVIETTYNVIAPYDFSIQEKKETVNGELKVFYEVTLVKNGIFNVDYENKINYKFKKENNLIVEYTEGNSQELEDGTIMFKKEFTEVKRYGNFELIISLECKIENDIFSYSINENYSSTTQSMPKIDSEFTKEEVYLTNDNVVGDVTYTIGENVKILVINGKSGVVHNIKIDVKKSNDPILIYLIDFNSHALTGNVITSKERTVTIWSYGSSKLIGGNGSVKAITPNDGESFYDFERRNENTNTRNGGHAIEVYDLYLRGDSLELKGGLGATGIGFGTQKYYSSTLYTYISGENGGNGGQGIKAWSNICLSIKSLTVSGGDGGNGANGLDSYIKTDPYKFYKGLEGVRGGNGGNGGDAIMCNDLIIDTLESINVVLYAGNGGNGGKGGNGGDGKDGVNIDNTLNGEDGYYGGNGGNGGASGYVINADRIFSNSLSGFTLHGGNGGAGGNGGKGGNGEDNSKWFSSGGDGGRGGQAGYGGDVYPSLITNLSGSYDWKIIQGSVGEGGKGGTGGVGGNGGTFGSKGKDGVKGGDGGAGTIITV